MMQKKNIILIVLILMMTGFLAGTPVAAASTELHIVKYANDGTTILNETTKNYQWLEANLPVLGDGSTHYYSQGPTFNNSDLWDDAEWKNIDTRDWGAVKGTDLRDICNLVGGMSPGETVTLSPNDGFSPKTFPYEYVYTPNPRQGSMGITWYRSDQGYVPGYSDGMRLVMFADAKTSTFGWNTSGWHVFGNADMRDTWAPGYWYNYSGTYPSSGGVSLKYVSDIRINSNQAPPDILFDGIVDLTPGETFIKHAYNNATGGMYTINRTTPLGALDAVAASGGFTYEVTDKRWSYDQVLLLDNLSSYTKATGKWYAYVNSVYKDGYGNHANGLNVIELSDNDQVNFYFAAGSDPNPVANATAVVRIKANITSPGPAVHTIYDGEAILTPGETFNVIAYNNISNSYSVNRTTPLGALDAVAASAGFTYNASDKRWSSDGVLLLDDIGPYLYKKPNVWYAYVNGAYKDGYGNHANGLNVIELVNGDQVNFYYAPNKDPNPVINATDVIRIRANTTAQPTGSDWALSLSGAKDTVVSKTLFVDGLACPSSGHQVFWTDGEGDVWGGVPLWFLVGMVDDNPDAGPSHYNFNDTIAALGYSVKVSSGDGWDTTLSSSDIARNDSYIVANTLNGQPLPRNLTSGKLSWPLHLKGAGVFGGQQVGNITRIELTGLPKPKAGWTLTLAGDVTDTITQSYFEDAIACHHNITYTDGSGNVWEGVALWDLAGAVDDIETTSHFTFNDTRAAANYTIRVSAADFSADFYSKLAAHNDGYIVANKMNGLPLSGTSAPLKLVGPATSSGKQRVGNITTISLIDLPDQFPAGNWQLNLNGTISDVIPQGEFEYWASHYPATYTDTNSNVYTGIPLWRLMGWVDDRVPHGSDGFNDAVATAGYTVVVKAGDGYAKEFTSQQIGKDDSFIVANTMNGAPIPTTGSHPPYPLRLVGTGATGGNSVGNIVEIQLTDFQAPAEIPQLHIIKYGNDGLTVIDDTTVNYSWMMSNLPVIGDGSTVYKFEGLTMNASNLWDPEETYPGGFKVSNAVKGSRVRDLAELVGGMGSGTSVTFVASDGFETTLPYSSIYTNPAVQNRQGDAIIAWYADGNYVPAYSDGMRLFFTPGGDHVYGAWDMHETLPESFWRYNYQNGVNYPSAAGLSAKYIVTMKVYSVPESDWTLELDGRDVGGIYYTVSKQFFQEALACQMGANHKATYTDGKGREWEGMPLWFLAGYVDDADQHSATSFNNTLASAGYIVMINSTDGSGTVVDSRLMMHNSNYIVANSLDGTHILESDSSWPLRFTGVNVTGSSSIKNVSSIRLLRENPVIPASAVGVWRGLDNGAGVFLLRESPAATTPVYYGLSTDTPLVGDWAGTGTDTVGVWRGLDNGAGVFFLRESPAATTPVYYGLSTDTPIIWNDNGISKVGVFRGLGNGAGVFYLRNSETVTTPVYYGLSTDTPLSGIDTVGVFRGLDTGAGVFYFRDSESVTTTTFYGLSTDTPIVGIWG